MHLRLLDIETNYYFEEKTAKTKGLKKRRHNIGYVNGVLISENVKTLKFGILNKVKPDQFLKLFSKLVSESSDGVDLHFKAQLQVNPAFYAQLKLIVEGITSKILFNGVKSREFLKFLNYNTHNSFYLFDLKKELWVL